MTGLALVIICSLAGGVLSLVGGICLLASRRHIKLAEYATAFAAGALLSAAFIDLLPEAAETGEPEIVFVAVLAGILAFFLLEGLVHWFHHHHHHDEHHPTDPVVPLVIIGDTVHNFIDGIAIAAAFLVDPLSGIIVTFAVAAHEIPQEIGDFGLLLHKGVKRSKVVLINIASALATTVAAVVFYLIGQSFDVSGYLPPVLGIVAGFFIYIAVSDIIPSIHHEKSRRLVLRQSIILLVGVILVGVVIRLLHGFIE